MEKVKLDFMIVPELLKERAYVPDAVRCKIIDPEAIFLLGILGESGRKLIKAGVELYLTRTLAENLISKGIAQEVEEISEEDHIGNLIREWELLIEKYRILEDWDLAREVESCKNQLVEILDYYSKIIV